MINKLNGVHMSKYLTKLIIEEILKLRDDGCLFHRENQTLEFKENFNFSGLAEYFRDFSAFANNKGGYLVFGVKDKPRRILEGMTTKSYEMFEKIDPEYITGEILKIFSQNIDYEFESFEINSKNYGVFYVLESTNKPIICKKGEGKNQELKSGEIYFRYGGRTQKIQAGELELIINERVEKNNKHWLSLIEKIGKAGPQNAAILDTERGLIEKNDSQVLIVDESLISQMKWIREGFFSEKEGTKTLRLVGEVTPGTQIEVIKRIIQNRLRAYPLSATQLAEAVMHKNNRIKIPEVWRIIKETNLKCNLDYSTYNFANKKQEDEYIIDGKLPKTIPISIYKESAIDFIINFYNSNYSKQ